MKILLLYNNYAANRRARVKYKAVLDLLRQNNIIADVKVTDYKYQSIEIIKESNLAHYDAVIGAGGDGTVFDVVNGIMLNPSETKIPFGVIPLGTGNAFARDLGLSDNPWQKSIEAIKNFRTIKTDLGFVKTPKESFYFSNICGFGFVMDAADTASRLKMFGEASYIFGVLYHIMFLNSFKLKMEIDGKVIERDNVFAEISNTRYTGKDFLMAPTASINDGLLDVTLLNKCSRGRVISCLPKIFKGTHVEMQEVETFKVKRVSFETDSPKKLTPDGEVIGQTPIVVECIPKALDVITNNLET